MIEELRKYIELNRAVGEAHFLRCFTSLQSHNDEEEVFDDRDLFYLMCFCLLVPAGNADRTNLAVESLEEKGFYEDRLDPFTVLKTIESKVRFPKQKFSRLWEFYKNKKRNLNGIKKRLTQNCNAQDFRDFLSNEIRGLGYKAASHYLRNIGFKELAILDVHILKYIKFFAPEYKDVTSSPTSKPKYLAIEKAFCYWAKEEFDIEPIILDWFIWCKEAKVPVDKFVR